MYNHLIEFFKHYNILTYVSLHLYISIYVVYKSYSGFCDWWFNDETEFSITADSGTLLQRSFSLFDEINWKWQAIIYLIYEDRWTKRVVLVLRASLDAAISKKKKHGQLSGCDPKYFSLNKIILIGVLIGELWISFVHHWPLERHGLNNNSTITIFSVLLLQWQDSDWGLIRHFH